MRLFFLVLLLFVGCAQPVPVQPAAQNPPLRYPDDLKNTHGTTFADGRRGSLGLAPGLRGEQVVALIGDPDLTDGSAPLGQVTWIYRWGGWANLKELRLQFAVLRDGLFLATWHWTMN